MTVSPVATRVTESFIDGVPVRSAETYPNIDPSTGATLGDVARAGEAEVDQAVTAARRASRGWRATTPEQRSELLSRLAGLIDSEAETLARLESEDSGKPLSQARNDARVCARYFRFYSHVIESYYGLSIPLRPDQHVYTRREPLGVTGSIVAWNYPMQLFGRAVAPAIATGNCTVLKPADETPRTAVCLARLAAAAGLHGCRRVGGGARGRGGQGGQFGCAGGRFALCQPPLQGVGHRDQGIQQGLVADVRPASRLDALRGGPQHADRVPGVQFRPVLHGAGGSQEGGAPQRPRRAADPFGDHHRDLLQEAGRRVRGEVVPVGEHDLETTGERVPEIPVPRDGVEVAEGPFVVHRGPGDRPHHEGEVATGRRRRRG